MTDSRRKNILATTEDFVGRTPEFDVIARHAKSENTPRALLLLSAPGVGASELLRQIYDRLFYENKETIPIYFAVKKSDQTARRAAVRFARTVIEQAIAFRRQDAKILSFVGDFHKISRFALPTDTYWIGRIIESCQGANKSDGDSAFLRRVLSAPLRAFANGARVFVMIDDLHEAEHFPDAADFLKQLQDVFGYADFPFVLAGRRRFLADKIEGYLEMLRLEPLTINETGILIEKLAARYAVKISDQARDLIAIQFGGNLTFIKFLLQAAGAGKLDLESFQQVERIYADEVFGGSLGKFYDRVFDELTPDVETQKNIIGLLYDSLTLGKEKTPIERWQNRSGLGGEQFGRAIALLDAHEIVRLVSNQVELMSENEVLNDYITARFRLEIMAENRALTISEMLSSFLKRAPQLMARIYRQKSAIDLRELMKVFDRQEIPLVLLDYDRFRNELKGAQAEEILQSFDGETEKIRLPQVVYAAYTAAFYPPIEQALERERSVVARGFLEGTYTDEDETIWIAAEIDSKLEATRETTDFWCDRLEMVALMCNFPNCRFWLIAPEGFAPETAEILRRRNAFGSSRRQVELLIKFLAAKDSSEAKDKTDEYEMIMPMSEDAEMIAARTIEEIAKRYNFQPKAINQMKTALVEACINAAEHSLSPDRRIYQKFTVYEEDKIVITIFNRGLRLADQKLQESETDKNRRGWGIKLMKTLMDDVKFEQTDDGTMISMTKYLKK